MLRFFEAIFNELFSDVVFVLKRGGCYQMAGLGRWISCFGRRFEDWICHRGLKGGAAACQFGCRSREIGVRGGFPAIDQRQLNGTLFNLELAGFSQSRGSGFEAGGECRMQGRAFFGTRCFHWLQDFFTAENADNLHLLINDGQVA